MLGGGHGLAICPNRLTSTRGGDFLFTLLLVFGALPPAVLNFLFAERYKQEPERVASIVLIGNLAALLFLPLALALVL